MADTRVATRCDNCGQTDDHPKFNYATGGDIETYHHDCIPARVMDDVEGDSLYEVVQNPMAPGGHALRLVSRRQLADDELPEEVVKLRKVVKAAKSGTHGEKLLAVINKLGEGN